MFVASDPVHDLGGTMRSRTAAETLAWIRPKLRELGITRVADVTGLDCVGIPVFVAIRPASKNLTTAQGKGLTRELAMLSAIMESIEDHHSEHPLPPARVGPARAVAQTARVLDTARLPPGYFPAPLDPDRELAWAQGRDLVTGEPVLVPHACVCLDTTVARPEYARWAVCTTGLASGNTTAEATCHALFEIIERDAHARWSAMPAAARRERLVDLATIDGACRHLVDAYARAELDVAVWELASPFAVPTYLALVTDRNPFRAIGTFGGIGTHLSPRIALSRALTEAAQSRLTFISGSRDDLSAETYRAQAASPAAPPSDRPARPFDATEPAPFTRFEDMCAELVARLVARGHGEVVVVDHQRPGWEVPVVHAFVPGLLDLPL